MTPIDDLELSQRLRALRVDPPANGFEARLAERLSSALPERASEAPPAAGEGRVLVGPWRRRGVVPLIGAAALFVAGAAAALEGGVVEWVQARVFQRASVPAERAPEAPVRHEASARRVAPETPPPAAAPAPPSEPMRSAPAAVEPPPSPVDVPRLDLERRARSSEVERSTARRVPSGPLAVPRVELIPHTTERRAETDGRVDRLAPRAGAAMIPRERGREIDRVREAARARREQNGAVERGRVLDRVREQRGRVDAERRELRSGGERRERFTR